MRFSEKLPKLRKKNNLSQEQLADKLGVSRQAVSKWESGSSYPDMEKLLQICKILNCHLEDIMDDGAIGNDYNNTDKKGKTDINSYMKDFLGFITKMYNMFCAMTFKEKIKCIFEMLLIGIILIIASNIILGVLHYIIYGLIPIRALWKVLSIILTTILLGISIIIFIHLFKIRYLDYFVTVEDQNVKEKAIEEPIEKQENKYYVEKSKEKIIIRDPKHSTLKFFDVLGKMIIIMIKLFAIFIAIPVVILFVLAMGFIASALFHVQYGNIFLFIGLAFVGGSLILYDIIEILYNFIVGRTSNYKKIFIIAITGLIMCGAGIGLSICTYLNFDEINSIETDDYISEIKEIKMDDNMYIVKNHDLSYEIDNSINDIKVEIQCVEGSDIVVGYHKVYNEGQYYYCYFFNNIDAISQYKSFIKDIKNEKIRIHGIDDIKIIVRTSQENYEKLEANFNKCN